MIEVVSSLAGLLLSSVHKGFDYMWLESAVGLSVLSLPIVIYFAKRLGVLFGMFAAYVLLHAQTSIFFAYGYFSRAGLEVKTAISTDACFSLLTLLIFVFATTELTPKWVDGVKKAIPIYTVLNALYVILVHIMGWRYGMAGGDQGFFDNNGMNACMIASGTGFLAIENEKKWVGVLKLLGLTAVGVALYFSHSAMAFGVLGVVLLTRYKKLWGLPVALIAGYLAVGVKMFDSSMRFSAYRVFLREVFSSGPYVYNNRWLFGVGLGSFKSFSQIIQETTQFMIRPDGKIWAWLFLHSDILQTIFEIGVVGFALSLLVLGRAVILAFLKRDLKMLSLLLGCLATSALDYPLRYPVFAFLCAFSVIEALRLPPEHPRELFGPRESFAKDKK